MPAFGVWVVLVLLLATAVSCWQLWQSHRDERRHATETTEQRGAQLASAVANRMLAMVRSVDYGLLQLRATEGAGTAGFQARAEALFAAFPVSSVLNSAVADADGKLVYSSATPTPAKNASLRGQPSFQAHLGGTDRLFIGTPVMNTTMKDWTIAFSRPRQVDGRFAGVAVINLSPQRLSQLLAALSLGPSDILALMDEDGFMLARNRDADKFIGQQFQPAPTLPGRETVLQGNYRARALTDGTDRFFAWHRVEGTRLLVWVGIDAAEVLGPLQAQHAREWLGTGLVSTALLALGIFVLSLLTRLARSQQAATDSATQLRRWMDGLGPDIFIGLMHTDGTLIEANRPALKAGGLTLADVTNRPLHEAAWWSHSAAVQQQLREAITRAAAGVPSRYDVQIRLADGSLAWIDFSLQPLRTDSGAVSHLVPSAMLIESRKQAEAALRESEQRLQAVTEHLSEGLIIANPEGRLLHWNRAALAIHGYADMSQCLRLLPEFVDTFTLSSPSSPPGSAPLAPQAWPMARVLAGETVQDEVLLLHHLPEGWTRTVRYSGATVPMADGRRLVYLSMTDVSARYAAESRIRQLNAELKQRVQQRTEQLEAKSKELESFCYSVSHDLKAPLRGIDGYSRLLLEGHSEKLDDEGRLFAKNVRTAAAQMTALIEDLLDYSRQERRSLELTSIELRPFVEEQLSQRKADFNKATLVVDIGDGWVAADRVGLAMALGNLIDNAIKFSAARAQPVITLRSQTAGERCVLSVHDNGSGFDMRFHDRIFEIFQRLHRVEEFPGTGIGLALVRKAAERMGGRVWAESAPDAGATFYLELQARDATARAPATMP